MNLLIKARCIRNIDLDPHGASIVAIPSVQHLLALAFGIVCLFPRHVNQQD